MVYKEYDFMPTTHYKRKIVLLTGVSGAGKDYLMDETRRVDHRIGSTIKLVHFGELLFRELDNSASSVKSRCSSRDDLRVYLSQEEVKYYIRRIIARVIEDQPLILNAHVFYKQNGSLHLNVDVERDLNVHTYLFVRAEPENIALWRLNSDRKRDVEDLGSIRLHQEIALESTKILARNLGAGFCFLDNRMDNKLENVAKIIQVINNICE